MRIKLIIAYDGTRYCGWQAQANALSIQTLVQKSIETVLRHPIELAGSGRTDAGVHALGQTAHFDTKLPVELNRLLYSVNALLPCDIRIRSAKAVSSDFHARYSAMGKIYHYHLHLDPVLDPMTRLYRTPVYGAFDLAAIKNAARFLIGAHDFAAFANKSDDQRSADDSIRTLMRLDIVEQSGGIRLEFEGDGFLYKMVRNITGTLLDVARGRRSGSEIPSILESRNRKLAGPAAPPQGLFLVEVKYPSI